MSKLLTADPRGMSDKELSTSFSALFLELQESKRILFGTNSGTYEGTISRDHFVKLTKEKAKYALLLKSEMLLRNHRNLEIGLTPIFDFETKKV